MSRVVLAEYQPAWPSQFRAVAAELAEAFAGQGVRVAHIGSTSVPGLCAKPVLDVLLGAPRLSDIEARADALLRIGYRYRPEVEDVLPERRYFVRAGGGGDGAASARLRVHLHGVVTGGVLWTRHLAFRDALRADEAMRRDYDALKRRLADWHRHDKAAYTAAKGPFVEAVLEAWRGVGR